MDNGSTTFTVYSGVVCLKNEKRYENGDSTRRDNDAVLFLTWIIVWVEESCS
jgi:hypothetical protein